MEGGKNLRVCDACQKEIIDTDEAYHIKIVSPYSLAEYDCCSVKCGSVVFDNLARQWKKERDDQGDC